MATVISAVKSKVRSGVSAVKSTVSSGVSTAKSTVSSGVSAVKSTVSSGVSTAKSKVSSGVSSGISTAKSVASTVKAGGNSSSGSNSSVSKTSSPGGGYISVGGQGQDQGSSVLISNVDTNALKSGKFTLVTGTTPTQTQTIQAGQGGGSTMSPVTAYNKIMLGETPTHADYIAATGITNPNIVNTKNPRLQDKVKNIALTAPNYNAFVSPNSFRGADGKVHVIAKGVKADPSWKALTPSESRESLGSTSKFGNYVNLAMSSPEAANKLLGFSEAVETTSPYGGEMTVYNKDGKIYVENFYMPDPKEGTGLKNYALDASHRGNPFVIPTPPNYGTGMTVHQMGVPVDYTKLTSAEKKDIAVQNLKNSPETLMTAYNALKWDWDEGKKLIVSPVSTRVNPIVAPYIHETYVDKEGTIRKTGSGDALFTVKVGEDKYMVKPSNILGISGMPNPMAVMKDTADDSIRQSRIQDNALWNSEKRLRDMSFSELKQVAANIKLAPNVVASNKINIFKADPTMAVVDAGIALATTYALGAGLGLVGGTAAKGAVALSKGKITPAAASWGLKKVDFVDDALLVGAAYPAGLGYDTRLWSAAASGDVSNLFERNTNYATARALTPQFFVNVLDYASTEAPLEYSAGKGWETGFGNIKDTKRFSYDAGSGLALPITTSPSGHKSYVVDGSREGYVFDPKQFMARATEAINSVKVSSVSIPTPINAKTGKRMTEAEYLTSLAGSPEAGMKLKEDTLREAKIETIRRNEAALNPSDITVYAGMVRNPFVKVANKVGFDFKPFDPKVVKTSDVFDSLFSKKIGSKTIDSKIATKAAGKRAKSTNAKTKADAKKDMQTRQQKSMKGRNANAAANVRAMIAISASLTMKPSVAVATRPDMRMTKPGVAITPSNRLPAVRNRLPATPRQDLAKKGDVALTTKTTIAPKPESKIDIPIALHPEFKLHPEFEFDDSGKNKKEKKGKNKKMEMDRYAYDVRNPFNWNR